MHRIWSIAEIVDEIVDCILPVLGPVPGETELAQSRPTLALLARTARLFFVPAVRRLWRGIEAAALQCLLQALQDGLPMRGKHKWLLQRYRFYEGFIQDLSVSSCDRPLPELADSYRIWQRALHPDELAESISFPKMRVLYLEMLSKEPPYAPQDHIFSALYWLAPSFLTPNLQKLRVIMDLQHVERWEKQVTRLFYHAAAVCPSLLFLDIADEEFGEGDGLNWAEPSNILRQNLPPIIKKFPALNKLWLPWLPSPELLEDLSTHPSLRDLKFTSCVRILDEEGEEPPLNEVVRLQSTSNGPFLELRKLDISGECAGLFHAIFPDHAYISPLTAPTQWLSALESLSLTLWDFQEVPAPVFSLSWLARRLQPHRQLKQLHFRIDFEPNPSDEDVLLLASTFPALETLSLCSSKTKTNLTLQSLSYIATHCTSLAYFDACFANLSHIPLAQDIAHSPNNITLVLSSNGPVPTEEVRSFVQQLWCKATLRINV